MKKIAGVLVFFSFLEAASIPDTCKQETWIAEGGVSAVLASGKIAYVGIGSSNIVGPSTGGLVPFTIGDHSVHTIAPVFPKVNGTVWAMCPDGGGGWFIGGLFILVDGLPRSNIAHVLPNGTVDPAWNPGADSLVTSLALCGTTLVAAGRFARIGGAARARLAAIDVQTGAVTPWNPGADRIVQCLAVSGTTVYAGGSFDFLGGRARSAVAALQVTSDTALSWNPDVNGTVYALAVYGTTVFAGGAFDSVGTYKHQNLVPLSAVTGDTVAGFRMYADSAVYALTISGTDVYVGGKFANIGGLARSGLAKFPAGGGLVEYHIQLTFNGPVYSIAVGDAAIYVGGAFTKIDDQERNYIAALDAGATTPGPWDPGLGGAVRTLTVQLGKLYIGGSFKTVGGQRRSGIIAIDGTTGKPTSFTTSVSGSVSAMAKLETTLYICGNFTQVGGQTRKYVAALDALSGSLLGWNPNPSGYVNALSVNGTTVYVGGDFDTIAGQPRSNIAAFDAPTGNLTSWNPSATWRVEAIAARGRTVYVGGGLSRIGGKDRNNIAALDSATGEALDWNPNANKPLFGLSVNGTTVYALGEFDTVGGQRRNSLAAIDALTGAVMPWDPVPNKRVRCLAVSGGVTYAGGYFDVIGGQSRKFIAALDTLGNALPWNPEAYGYAVETMTASGGAVYAAGSVTSLGRGVGHPNFAQFGDFRAAPAISAVTPSSGLDSGGAVLTVQGAEFRSGAAVKLVKSGQADRVATVASVSPTSIACAVNVKDAAGGPWDVVVTNDDLQADTLVGGFSVAPAAPTLVSPESGASGVGLTPTLLWHKAPGDSLYSLQLSASADFSLRIINNGAVPDTAFSIPQALANGTAYYWKVASTKKGGAVTAFSPAWKFTTVSLPGQVALLSPPANALLQTDSVAFQWNKSQPDADKYRIEVFTDSLLSGRLAIDSGVTDTAYVLRGLHNKKSYWWRVAAHGGVGWGGADNVRKFTVDIPSVASIPSDFSCVVQGLSKSGSMIRYGLPAASWVSLRLYGVSGRLLKALTIPRQSAGYHKVPVPVQNLPKGYVILDFRAGAFTTTRMIPIVP